MQGSALAETLLLTAWSSPGAPRHGRRVAGQRAGALSLSLVTCRESCQLTASSQQSVRIPDGAWWRGTGRTCPPSMPDALTRCWPPPSAPASASPRPSRSTRRRGPCRPRICSVSGPSPGVQSDQRRRRVEQHRVAHRAALAVQQAAGDLRVVRRVGAAQRLHRHQLEADVPRVEGLLAHRAVPDHPHPRGRGRGQLVQAVVAAEDQRGASRARRSTPARMGAIRGVGDTGGLRPHLGRVGQRAEEVEGGADAQLGRAPSPRAAAPGGTSPRSRR